MTVPAAAGTAAGTVSEVGGPVLRASGVRKGYGNTQALAGVDLAIRAGEIVGLVGHNGAGKSTLLRLLAGVEAPDTGDVALHGRTITGGPRARARALRTVRVAFQETSLCPELTVAENVALSSHGRRQQFNWRRAAAAAVASWLDDVFPANGISPSDRVEDLSLAQRQMAEVARASLVESLDVLMLDEPTEALDHTAATSLYNYVRACAARGVSILLVSHRIGEVLSVAERVIIMRDGRVVAERFRGEVDETMIIADMGGHASTSARSGPALPAGQVSRRDAVAELTSASGSRLEDVSLQVHPGEIVGLAGLTGHGQHEVLERLWGQKRRGVRVTRSRAYVPGDRQRSGVFPLWSVADNLIISAMRQLARRGVIHFAAERKVVNDWERKLGITGDLRGPMVDLSGGNQQKVIVARAFASDAELILLDDPFRGVDASTRLELYELIRAEAHNGRAMVWYSSENSEMAHCDRVYVFRSGRIVAELAGEGLSEEAIIAASFADGPRDNDE